MVLVSRGMQEEEEYVVRKPEKLVQREKSSGFFVALLLRMTGLVVCFIFR